MTATPSNALAQFYSTTPWVIQYFDFVAARPEDEPKRIVGYYYAHVYTPKLVQSILEESGFKKSENPRDSEILVGTKPEQRIVDGLKPCQRICHFNKAFCIGTKSAFHRAATALSAKLDNSFQFYLPTYILPEQLEEFKAAAASAPLWIQKPVGRSRSRGIKLLTEAPEALPEGSRVVVQKYAPYPLLIDEKKFDIRVYAAVISADPLLIYLYNEGFMRIAKIPFNENSMKMECHMTTVEDCAVENLDRLWPLLESSKLDPALIRQRMEDVIAGIIAINRENFLQQKNPKNSFQLYGFDFIVTLDGNIYFFEANVSPSMSFRNKVEENIKKQLMVDLFNLVSLPKDTPELEKMTSTLAEADNKDISDFMTVLYFDQYQKRCGNFRCIFPTPQRHAQNTKFLEQPSQADIALALWNSLSEEKKNDKVKVGVRAWAKIFP
jgi:tubulin polyglutamylase TTLL4